MKDDIWYPESFNKSEWLSFDEPKEINENMKHQKNILFAQKWWKNQVTWKQRFTFIDKNFWEMNLYTQKFIFDELKQFDSRTKYHAWPFRYHSSGVQCLAVDSQCEEKFQWIESPAISFQARLSL